MYFEDFKRVWLIKRPTTSKKQFLFHLQSWNIDNHLLLFVNFSLEKSGKSDGVSDNKERKYNLHER